MKKNKKLVALVCCVLMLVGAAGATLAWLTDQTQTVTNTFTTSDINITLEETDADQDNDADNNSYKMVPGSDIAKDPKVTVEAGSEACWLFVKVTESNNFDTYMKYGMAEGWTALENEDGVYWREVAAVAEGTAEEKLPVYSVLAGDKVAVLDTVTKEHMEALKAEGATLPTLTFKAYAVQKANIATAADAWKTIPDSEK